MTLLFLWLALAQTAPSSDRYPMARELLRDAEHASAGIRFLDDKNNPHTWIASLYARGGYLRDAARVFGKQSEPNAPPYLLWRAYVLYGELSTAERMLDGITDIESRARAITSLADLLWRMGDREGARARYEKARLMAAKVTNPRGRKILAASIQQGLTFLSEEPPQKLSATPKPRERLDARNPAIPSFPITTGGFQEDLATDMTRRTEADGDFLKELYAKIEAGDRAGLERVVEAATTPFRKALGLASIEHVLILIGQPQLAEQYATQIPESDANCKLAKAEAMAAAGGAWLRFGDAARAQSAFEAARTLVNTVHDLGFGRVAVMVAVATAEFTGGMVASSDGTLRKAYDLARELPMRPPPSQVSGSRGVRRHYRDDAYTTILLAAIRTHNLSLAHDITRLWEASGGAADIELVRAWLDAGLPEQAIAAARAMPNRSQKAKALLTIAQALLDSQGAPIF